MQNKQRKRHKHTKQEIERLENDWYTRKSALMENILGKEYHTVMHALIPYEVGGALDLYYYPNGIAGTGIATKELSYACSESSHNSRYAKYELVMFTEYHLDLDIAQDETTPFGAAHENISAILNHIAPYSAQATLSPYETCEFPEDMKTVGGKCLIFDSYEPPGTLSNEERFGVMLIMELFRDEMEFAMEHGGELLLSKLKEKGVYPFSNLSRVSVVSS
ncbi:MAG: hypothetical protein RBS80_29645 [Thermoguttaceae bacterium]|jgi:hypothetical protein|nr:hypothetical protein [Thermoguttaceae bacterium]